MIIGLCGAARSGKDTVADLIAAYTPGGVFRVPIAGPMKQFCRELFDWTVEHTDGKLKETPDTRYRRPCPACKDSKRPGYWDRSVAVLEGQGGPMWRPCHECGGSGHTYLTPREALQRLGHDWSTPLYENIWVEKAIREATARSQGGKTAVITDCRFLRDITAVKKAGGLIVLVERPGTGLTGAAATHQGETERQKPEFLEQVDLTIQNRGSLEDLGALVEHLVYTWHEARS